MKRFLPLLLFSFLSDICNSQNAVVHQRTDTPVIDSLLRLLKDDKEDTLKAIHQYEICWEYKNIGLYETATSYGKQSLQLSQKLLYRSGIAYAYNDLGVIYKEEGKYDKALENHFASLKMVSGGNEKSKEDKQIASNAYNNIGVIYYEQGNYKSSLENYFSALKIQKEINDLNGIASSYGNIGIIYTIQGNYELALVNQSASLKFRKESGDQRGLADCYLNTGAIYELQGGAAENKENKRSLYDKAIENYSAALKLKELTADIQGISSSYLSIGSIYVQEKKYEKAIEIFKQSFAIAKKIGAKEIMKDAYRNIADAYLQMNDLKLSYQYYRSFSDLKDTLFNEMSAQKTAEMGARFENEKKEEQIKLLEKDKEKQLAVTDAENRKKNVIIGSIIGILLLALFFSGFVLRSLRITRKQKETIESQKIEVERSKHLVEEKQKEMIDSILYAERIQKSLLPTEKYIDKNLRRLQKK